MDGEQEVRGQDLEWRPVQHYSHCTILDPASYFSHLHRKELIINVRKMENIGVTIFIEDKKEAVSRAIKSNLQVYSGAKIALRNAKARRQSRKYSFMKDSEYIQSATFFRE